MTLPARAQSPRRTAERREYFTPVYRSALQSGMNPKLLAFLAALEDFSAERTCDYTARWGIVYDADLRPMFGSDDSIGRLWKQAEEQGYVVRVRTAKGARIGFIWLRRVNDRPVATAETLEEVKAELEAAVASRKGRARTILMGSQDPCTYRRIAGAPTAELRVHLPQNCGGSDAAPYSNPARGLDPEKTLKTTTTHAGESSSSLNPSTQSQEPERLVTIELPPSAADPPAVPELPAELVARAAEAIPGATRQWLAELLRDCAHWGLELALLIIAWVAVRQAKKPVRYARIALAGWLNQLRAGTIDLAGIREEVYGRPGVAKPFDSATLLARMRAIGWRLIAIGDGQVKWEEIPESGACAWEKIPSDLREQIQAHKAELKAYVLGQGGKGVSRGDP